MRWCVWSIMFLAVLLPSVSLANQGILWLQQDDTQWSIPAKNYSAIRYSTLGQITPSNVNKPLEVRSFSTGALRGYEGPPLVVGTIMCVHSVYPTYVYALDLSKEGAPITWKYTPAQDDRATPVACCVVVHRGLNYAEGKTLIDDGTQVWKAYSTGPDDELKLASDFNAANPQRGQKGEGTKTWPGDQWKIHGGTTWAWYSVDPDLNLLYSMAAQAAMGSWVEVGWVRPSSADPGNTAAMTRPFTN